MGAKLLRNNQRSIAYNFARTVGGDTAATMPSSYNEIKKFAGFLGIITKAGEPLSGVVVTIKGPTGTVIGTATTDVDGYYMLESKQKAKSANYTLSIPSSYGIQPVTVTIKANGFAAVNFEIP